MLILIRFASSLCLFLLGLHYLYAHSYQDSGLKEKERKGKEIVIITQIFFSSLTCTTYTTRKEMASFLEVNFALCTRQLLIAELL